MSQDLAIATRTSSTSPHEERHKRLPPLGSRTLPPIQASNTFGAPPNGSPDGNLRYPARLPATSDQRSSRPIGVKNLLNPTSSGESPNGQNRHQNGEHVHSPTRIPPLATLHRAATPSLPAPSITTRSPINVSLPSITPPPFNVHSQTLGRSPSTYAPSPGPILKAPTATIDAKQSPFVVSRDHSNSGGQAFGLSEINRVPSSSGDAYGDNLHSNRSPPGQRRSSQESARYDHMQRLVGSTGGAGAGSHPSASLSDSPSTQYSSYSQVSRQTPPVQQGISTGQPQSFFTTPFNPGGPASTMTQLAFEVPASSSGAGGSTYQMMTLDTENGPIQVPVDVQAASKVADEKRKRNATASHRFRQRRKEKERETSQNISKLETQIRDMEEEREFYRGERDYFRNLASRVPGQAHLLPRPLSPRQRRHASMSGAMGFGNVQFQSPEGGNRTGGRNTKRRTSSYVPPTGPPPQAEAVSAPSFYQQAQPNNVGGNRGRPPEAHPGPMGSFDPSTKR